MAEIYPLQVIGVLFSVLMIFFTYYTYKRKDFSRADAVTWFAIWLWFFIATAFSSFVDRLLAPLKLLSLFDLLLVSGVGILLVLVVALNKRLAKAENKIEVVVRKIAMDEAGIGTKMRKKR